MLAMVVTSSATVLRKFARETRCSATPLTVGIALICRVELLLAIVVQAEIDAVHNGPLAHQARQGLHVHHAPDAEIVLHQRNHREGHRSPGTFQQIDFDGIPDADAEDLPKHAGDRQAGFGKHDGPQIDINDAVEIGIAPAAADRNAPLDIAVPDADRDLADTARRQARPEVAPPA